MLMPQLAKAQAWPQARGSAYVKVSHGRAAAAEQYTFDGRRRPYADNVVGDAFADRSGYLYAEYGWTEHVTVVGSASYKYLHVEDAAFTYETGAFSTLTLGVRVGLKPLLGWNAPQQALAANVSVSLPLGYTRNLAPAVGAGQVDAQASLAYGLSLYPFPGYAQAGAGYRYRSSVYALSQDMACQPGRDLDCTRDVQPAYDDEWFLDAEAGVSLGRWVLVQVLSQAVLSVRAPTAETSFTARNPIPTRQRYLKVGAGLSLYPIPAIGISLQSFATPAGRNTIRSTDWFIGVEYIVR